MRSVFCCLLLVLTLGSTSVAQGFPHRVSVSSLGTFGQIKHASSDSRSNAFSRDVIPQIQNIAFQMLASGKEFGDRHQFRLDQDKLFTTSTTPYPVRVYFIAEGAGYQNSVGVSLNYAGSESAGDMRLIFPNASMPVSGADFRTANFGVRRHDAPLIPGDYVDLGVLRAGVQLDFFLVRDGARRGTDFVFTNHDEANPDRTQHVVSFAIPNSPFLLIGFEDLWMGGDKDYEDVLIVVDLGVQNIANLIDASDLPN